MFAAPAIIWAVFLPSLKQGLPDPIPAYERILLDIAVFCGGWKWLLAILIPVVLFTIAAFTSASRVGQQYRPTRNLDNRPLTRPVGITVIAALNIVGGLALALGASEMISSHRPEDGLVWMLVVGAILSVGLGVGLLRLQNWARAVVVVLYGLSLIRILGHVIFVHNVFDAFIGLVPASYVLWAFWYMHQPHVKASFRRAQLSLSS
jgi:hypothetical protein